MAKFESAIKELCEQIGLSGNETEYAVVCFENIRLTAIGIDPNRDNTSEKPAVREEVHLAYMMLHGVLDNSVRGQEILKKYNGSVPFPPVFLDEGKIQVNPIFRLESDDGRLPELMSGLDRALGLRSQVEGKHPRSKEK